MQVPILEHSAIAWEVSGSGRGDLLATGAENRQNGTSKKQGSELEFAGESRVLVHIVRLYVCPMLAMSTFLPSRETQHDYLGSAGGKATGAPTTAFRWQSVFSPGKHWTPRHPGGTGHFRAVSGDVRRVQQLGRGSEALGTVAPLPAVVTLPCENEQRTERTGDGCDGVWDAGRRATEERGALEMRSETVTHEHAAQAARDFDVSSTTSSACV